MDHSSTERALPKFHQIHRLLPEAERTVERALLATLQEQRAAFVGTPREGYDAMTSRTPLAGNVSVEAIDQSGVRGCWVRPGNAVADRAILFLHGGAYLLGSAQGYRGFASQIATRSQTAAFVLDYPLAPEHPFPAAYDATVAALAWLKAQEVMQIALVGDSAGGGLALACLGEPPEGLPTVASVAAFSPWTDLANTGASFNDPRTHDPVFQRALITNAAAKYLGAASPRDGRASPLYAVPNFLPPLLIQVGTDELLLDDSTRYAAAAAGKGGEVQIEIYEGLHHVFQRCVEELPSARLAFDSAARFLSAHWN